jgi:hypothetical protein
MEHIPKVVGNIAKSANQDTIPSEGNQMHAKLALSGRIVWCTALHLA